jgi:hypothetical protein
MCGRFALGVNVSGLADLSRTLLIDFDPVESQADVVRMGVADYLPNILDRQQGRNRPNERQRRAQAGQEGRDRERIRRERRRAGPQIPSPSQVAADIEEDTSDHQVDEEDGGLSQKETQRRARERAESIPWDDEEHWRPENFNVAPRSNCPVVVMRPMVARLRGGGEGGEKLQTDAVHEEDNGANTQPLRIETM